MGSLYTIGGFLRATLQFIRILRSADCLQPHDTLQFLRVLALHKRAVEVVKTQMTFSVSRDSSAFEWISDGLHSMFCQPRRVSNMRFNACAVRVTRP
jgi:hypothetical protein